MALRPKDAGRAWRDTDDHGRTKLAAYRAGHAEGTCRIHALVMSFLAGSAPAATRLVSLLQVGQALLIEQGPRAALPVFEVATECAWRAAAEGHAWAASLGIEDIVYGLALCGPGGERA